MLGQPLTFLSSLLLLISLLTVICCRNVSATLSMAPFLVDGEVNTSKACPHFGECPINGVGHRCRKSEGLTGRTLLWHLTNSQATMHDNFVAKENEDTRQKIKVDVKREKNNGTMQKDGNMQEQQRQTVFKQQNIQKPTRKDKIGKAVKIKLFHHLSNRSSETLPSSRPIILPTLPTRTVIPPQKLLGEKRKMLDADNEGGAPAIAPHSPGTVTTQLSPGAMQTEAKEERKQRKPIKDKKSSKKKNKNRRLLLLKRIFTTGNGIPRNATMMRPALNGTSVSRHNDKNARTRWKSSTSNAKTAPCNAWRKDGLQIADAQLMRDPAVTDHCRCAKDEGSCRCLSAADCFSVSAEPIVAEIIIGESGVDDKPFVSTTGAACQPQTVGQSLLQDDNDDQQDQLRRQKIRPIVFPPYV